MPSQIVTSATEGGVAGYKASGGNPWGAVIGVIVGGIGGGFADKAEKYRRKANAQEQHRIDLAQGVQRRDLIRSAFLARSEALASAAGQESGAMQGSAVKGALSSISSQTFYNLKFFDANVISQQVERMYNKKAKKQQGSADMISGFMEAIGGAGGGMGSMGG